MTLRLATRASAQARIQAEFVASLLLERAGRAAELVFVQTSGDRQRDRPLAEIGGQGIFVKEVQAAVLEGAADVAVHSAKDLPSSWSAEGLVIGAVPLRRDPRDALVGTTLAALPKGATVATGSARRQAQLAALRPDLRFVGLRGNIGSRVARADDPEVDAVIVAMTGVQWVGLSQRIAEPLTVEVMVPQVGQGAMALECRADDASTRDALRSIEDGPSRVAVDLERAFLARLGGGCELPVGAHAVIEPDGQVWLRAMLARDATGAGVARGERRGTGMAMAEELADELTAAVDGEG